MARRKCGARVRRSDNLNADSSLPSTLPLFPTPEEFSICDVAARLSPGVDSLLLLEHLRKDAHNRRERVLSLRRRVLAGEYYVAPGAVAAAILQQGNLFLH